MDVFVYVRGVMPQGLDEVEDALDEALGNTGEVTGSGSGIKGSNFDIEISDDQIDIATALSIVRKALERFKLPISTVIVIDGTEYPLTP